MAKEIKHTKEIKEYLDKIIAVALFSIAFGLVEAMVVIYLRQILATTNYDIFTNTLQLSTKAVLFSLGFVVFLRPEVLSAWDTLHLELFREAVTIVMLISLAWATGKTWREKLAFFLLSFGTWDIFYYIWLNRFIGWPASLLNIDILFLIPVPWMAPIFMPILISLLMIVTSFYLLSYSSKT